MSGKKKGKAKASARNKGEADQAVQNQAKDALMAVNKMNVAIQKTGPTLNNTLEMVQNNVRNTSVMLNKFNSTNINASTNNISFNYTMQSDGEAEKKAQGTFAKIWKGVKSVGSASVKAGKGLGTLISSTTESASRLDQMKSATGLDYEELQKLQYISSQLSVDFDKAGGAIGAMSKNMSDGGKTGSDTANAFRELGVNVNGSKPKGQIFNETIAALSQMQDQTQRNELAFKIFGSGAEDLFPILNAGTGEVQRLGAEADKLGMVMSNDKMAASSQLGGSIEMLKGSFMGLGNNLAATVAPQVQILVDGLIGKMPQLQTMVQGIAGALADGIGSVMPTILGFIDYLIPILMQFMPIITSIITEIFSFIKLLLPPISQLILGLLPILAQLINIIFIAFQPLFDVFIILVQALLPPVMQILQAIMPMLQAITPIVAFIANLIGVVLFGAIKLIMPFIEDLVNHITAFVNGLGKVFGWIGNIFGLNNKNKDIQTNIQSNIQPNLPPFANGGFANGPSIFGEAGPEAAIPIKYKNPRSLSLLNQTAKAIGAEPGGSMPGVALSFNFYGPVNNKNDVCEGIKLSRDYIVQVIEDMINEKERVAFG